MLQPGETFHLAAAPGVTGADLLILARTRHAKRRKRSRRPAPGRP
jgi:hypothetical protein